ncbi:MAG TPA: class I SAM-dependent methyltransferase [Drouetiella sp.]
MTQDVVPDNTAIRTALWRALHVECDEPPHVLNDLVGLKIADPPDDWRERPDMHLEGTKPFRASIVARARFMDDLVVEQNSRGVHQYVILGAGLDTFALRNLSLAKTLKVYEVDQPATQAWKKTRLKLSDIALPESLHFVPVDFEAGDDWWKLVSEQGFDASQPAVVTSTGVSMYLTKEANAATLAQVSKLAPGSSFAMTFSMPFNRVEPWLQPILERAAKGAAASGTPFISFYEPEEIIQEALKAGFKEARHISAAALTEKYFADRTDGLRPPLNAEEILLATT